MGIEWVLIGQAERRTVAQESEEETFKKLRNALDKGMQVVYCLGDSIIDKDMNTSMYNVLGKQLEKLKAYISNEEFSKIIFCYEPYWRIYSSYEPIGPFKDVDYAI